LFWLEDFKQGAEGEEEGREGGGSGSRANKKEEKVEIRKGGKNSLVLVSLLLFRVFSPSKAKRSKGRFSAEHFLPPPHSLRPLR
jgi:hypothetical protein